MDELKHSLIHIMLDLRKCNVNLGEALDLLEMVYLDHVDNSAEKEQFQKIRW